MHFYAAHNNDDRCKTHSTSFFDNLTHKILPYTTNKKVSLAIQKYFCFSCQDSRIYNKKKIARESLTKNL